MRILRLLPFGGLLLGLLLAACSSDSEPGANGGPSPSEPSDGMVKGLFLEPRPVQVTKKSLPSRPQSKFNAHDRKSVVLYDLQNGRETNLGEGRVVSPAFSMNRVIHTAGGEVFVRDLTSGDRKSLGQGTLAFFIDENTAAVLPPNSRTLAVDLRTGASTVTGNLADIPIRDQESGFLGGPLRLRELKGGYILRYESDADKVCATAPVEQRRLCAARERENWVVEDTNRQTLLKFRALNARPAGPDEILIATSPQCDDGAAKAWCEDVLAKMEAADPRSFERKFASGNTNLFLVNVKSGQSRFVASVDYDPFTQVRPYNWPMDADADYVVWTENYCGQTQGKTRIYDRKANRISELEASFWVRMANGQIGAGEFGPTALIDPASFTYKTVMPDNVVDVVWSGDYKYAAVGAVSGHGGLCGG